MSQPIACPCTVIALDVHIILGASVGDKHVSDNWQFTLWLQWPHFNNRLQTLLYFYIVFITPEGGKRLFLHYLFSLELSFNSQYGCSHLVQTQIISLQSVFSLKDLFYMKDITNQRGVWCETCEVHVCFSLLVYTVCVTKEPSTFQSAEHTATSETEATAFCKYCLEETQPHSLPPSSKLAGWP